MIATTFDALLRRDLDFQLYAMQGLGDLVSRERYAEHDVDSFASIIDTAYDLAGERFAPIASDLDAFEPTLRDGVVHTLPALQGALDAFIEAGFMAVGFDAKHGGMQLPHLMTVATQLIFSAANGPAAGYPFLTQGAANLLAVFASPEQQKTWLEPMVEGRYFGTMALTEPQAGSSLAEVATIAVPHADGTYRLTGNKMWISGSEHELSENIINLVLARLPGAPAGVKGISLFIVPKFALDPSGNATIRNDITVVGLNHKLGQRGISNCALSLGDRGACIGYLVGQEHAGMRQMFHMMNEARIGIGAWATCTAYAAYRYALDYAKTRPQGRRTGSKDPTAPPVPIVEHADVRRMLLAQKAIVEGGLAIVTYCARLVDDDSSHPEPAEREAAHQLLEVLTPIAKTWPSEHGCDANSLAIQVLGGYGYSPEYPVERLFRDQRLNPIHEGTTGIQGLDLLGRKVTLGGGIGFTLLLARMRGEIAQARTDAKLASEADALAASVDRAEAVTAILVAAQRELGAQRALANATIYLDALGTIVIAWMWLAQARVANAHAATTTTDAFYAGKLTTCRYFFRYELPKTTAMFDLLATLDDTTTALDIAEL